MLEKIKILLGLQDNAKDELLFVLTECVKDELKAYCRTDDIKGLESLVVDMVIYKYNRLGTEGLQSESYSGASYAYLNDYPETLKAAMNDARRKHNVLKVY